MAETCKLGSGLVPVFQKLDWLRAPEQAYRKTYTLRPGDSWFDAESTPGQREIYVLDQNCIAVPVGAMIARELKFQGAVEAGFVELWGGVVVVDENLKCIPLSGRIGAIISEVKNARDGKLAGFPDVVGIFPDGRISFREAKSVSSKDKISVDQHDMADILRALYGEKADIALVYWDF